MFQLMKKSKYTTGASSSKLKPQKNMFTIMLINYRIGDVHVPKLEAVEALKKKLITLLIA